ncbi:MAG: DUF2442 domain-containing protein [Holophagaceae bacterium]|nr:DUF2442 domain-containing protein [Holophagaceae bacterium]
MFYRVKEIVLLPDLILKVIFENGIIKRYDMKPLMEEREEFQDLNNYNLFSYARVTTRGLGIEWNDYIDLSCNELWHGGTTIDSSN